MDILEVELVQVQGTLICDLHDDEYLYKVRADYVHPTSGEVVTMMAHETQYENALRWAKMIVDGSDAPIFVRKSKRTYSQIHGKKRYARWCSIVMDEMIVEEHLLPNLSTAEVIALAGRL